MDNWKEYADKVAEMYSNVDKKTVRKIAFYGFRAMYNMASICKDTTILMMPGNHYVSFGNIANPGKEFDERMKEARKEENKPNKFFTILNGKVIPSWFRFPEFNKEYYVSISFKTLMGLKKNGNTLKNVVMSSSLDYMKLFGNIIIKVPSPVFHGDVWKGTISFVTYSIISNQDNSMMSDMYYKYNKPQEINYFENGKKGYY